TPLVSISMAPNTTSSRSTACGGSFPVTMLLLLDCGSIVGACSFLVDSNIFRGLEPVLIVDPGTGVFSYPWNQYGRVIFQTLLFRGIVEIFYERRKVLYLGLELH